MPNSKGEATLFEIICQEWPSQIVVAQHPIKPWGDRGKTLYVDYYIPSLRIAIEYDGNQHDEFVPFFHSTVSGFEKSVANDEAKNDWCKAHKINLIRFGHREKVTADTLRAKIKGLAEAKKERN